MELNEVEWNGVRPLQEGPLAHNQQISLINAPRAEEKEEERLI